MCCVNCEECKHLKSVVYMKLETETLYNSWCDKSVDVIEVYKSEECKEFEQK